MRRPGAAVVRRQRRVRSGRDGGSARRRVQPRSPRPIEAASSHASVEAGVDDRGRDVLSFVDGHVAWEAEQPPDVTSERSLVAVARLVRQFHDPTAGTELAGDEEVACHNDLSPENTVYRDQGHGLRPVAFIDWDIAAPGARVHDVAHVCWQYVGLGSDADVARAGHRIRMIADAYGPVAAPALVDTILWWQDRCWRESTRPPRPGSQQ